MRVWVFVSQESMFTIGRGENINTDAWLFAKIRSVNWAFRRTLKRHETSLSLADANSVSPGRYGRAMNDSRSSWVCASVGRNSQKFDACDTSA